MYDFESHEDEERGSENRLVLIKSRKYYLGDVHVRGTEIMLVPCTWYD